MKKEMKGILVLALALVMVLPLAANGDKEAAEAGVSSWPTGPVTAYVPAKPGGNMDVKIRIMAKYLEPILDTNFVVNNVPGGGGAIELTQYLTEKPNGNAIAYCVSGQLAVTPLFGALEYSLDDFEVVARTDVVNIGVFVRPDQGIDTLEDLKAYSQGEILKFSATGVNSAVYIHTKYLLNEMGIESDIITDKGFPSALVNVASGTADVAAVALNLARPYVEDGSLIPLAVCSEDDYDGYADLGYESVPSLMNLGYDIIWDSMSFIMMRAGTDQVVVDRLAGALDQVFSDPEFQKEFAEAGYYQLDDISSEAAHASIKYKIEAAKKYFNSVQQQ